MKTKKVSHFPAPFLAKMRISSRLIISINVLKDFPTLSFLIVFLFSFVEPSLASDGYNVEPQPCAGKSQRFCSRCEDTRRCRMTILSLNFFNILIKIRSYMLFFHFSCVVYGITLDLEVLFLIHLGSPFNNYGPICRLPVLYVSMMKTTVQLLLFRKFIFDLSLQDSLKLSKLET